MNAPNFLMTVPQIVKDFKVSVGAVRAWIAAGLLVSSLRGGQGRFGQMFFMRGDVTKLVRGTCPVCGNSFDKATLKQKFCGQVCRQRFSRMHEKKPKR